MIQVGSEAFCKSALQMRDQARARVVLLSAPETHGNRDALIGSIGSAVQDSGMDSQGRARSDNCRTFIAYQFRRDNHWTTQPNRQGDHRLIEGLTKVRMPTLQIIGSAHASLGTFDDNATPH